MILNYVDLLCPLIPSADLTMSAGESRRDGLGVLGCHTNPLLAQSYSKDTSVSDLCPYFKSENLKV